MKPKELVVQRGYEKGLKERFGDHWEEMKKLLQVGMTGRDEAGGRFALSASFYEDSGLLFGKNGYEDLFETKTNDVKTIF